MTDDNGVIVLGCRASQKGFETLQTSNRYAGAAKRGTPRNHSQVQILEGDEGQSSTKMPDPRWLYRLLQSNPFACEMQ